MASGRSYKKGWLVTFAGTGINLALGILYTWSIFRSEIQKSIMGHVGVDTQTFQWDLSEVNDPYAVCCLVFAFSMIPAGRFQDKLGPRPTAAIGGLLVGLGFWLISQSTDYWAWILGFGVLAGAGIGCGYAAATPAAVKWFPSEKTGLITGLVVSGFGLAPFYISPLSNFLIAHYGLIQTMQLFGIAFLFIVVFLSFFLVNPPEGPHDKAIPPGPSETATGLDASKRSSGLEILGTGNFYLIWLAYFIGAGAGLMVISSINSMAQKSLGELAFMAVAILAVGNALGRISAGLISDRIGRENTLMIMLTAQAVLMFVAMAVVDSPENSALVIILLATMIGFNYGANLSIFPAITKDLWGMTHFGVNYGLVFSAWGVGGFVFSRVYQMITSGTGGRSSMGFMAAGFLLILGVGIAFLMKRYGRSSF